MWLSTRRMVLAGFFMIAIYSGYRLSVADSYVTGIRGAMELTAVVQRTDQWVTPQAQPFNEGGVAAKARHLIIVAGHSVTVSGHLEDADRDESDWYLLSYQKNHGLPSAILAHIREGIAHAAANPDALLIFSGGQTRASTGPDSEGASYYRVADAMKLWTIDDGNTLGSSALTYSASTVRARTTSEDFATDSFQNLLFSICRFYEITGTYPESIYMVSFTFKQHRFEALHVPTLRWPTNHFHFVGVDPPSSTGFDLAESTRGELENAARPFETDPYGCHSDILKLKRRERNPFSRTPPYDLSCPDMKELFHHCGPELIPMAKVPWGSNTRT